MQVSGPTVGLSWRKPWLNPAPTLTQRTLHLAQRGLAGLPALQFSHRGPRVSAPRGETKTVHIRTPLGKIRPHPHQDAGQGRRSSGEPLPTSLTRLLCLFGCPPYAIPSHMESPLCPAFPFLQEECPSRIQPAPEASLSPVPGASWQKSLWPASTKSWRAPEAKHMARGLPSPAPSEGQVHGASIWIRAPGCFGGNSPGHRQSGEALFPREKAWSAKGGAAAPAVQSSPLPPQSLAILSSPPHHHIPVASRWIPELLPGAGLGGTLDGKQLPRPSRQQ